MVLWFGTKRNKNGFRRYLGFSTGLRVYSKKPNRWLVRKDFTEVCVTDMKRLEKELVDCGFNRCDNAI